MSNSTVVALRSVPPVPGFGTDSVVDQKIRRLKVVLGGNAEAVAKALEIDDQMYAISAEAEEARQASDEALHQLGKLKDTAYRTRDALAALTTTVKDNHAVGERNAMRVEQALSEIEQVRTACAVTNAHLNETNATVNNIIAGATKRFIGLDQVVAANKNAAKQEIAELRDEIAKLRSRVDQRPAPRRHDDLQRINRVARAAEIARLKRRMTMAKWAMVLAGVGMGLTLALMFLR